LRNQERQRGKIPARNVPAAVIEPTPTPIGVAGPAKNA